MKRSKLILITGILIVVLLLLYGSYLVFQQDNAREDMVSISFVGYGTDSERWENLKRGAEQAAEDVGAEVNFVFTTDENDVEEERRLLQREIEYGADGLMVAVNDSREMGKYMENYHGEAPVVFVESGIGSNEKYSFVGTDNYQFGYDLGSKLAENEVPESKVAIICEHDSRDSVDARYRGLYDALQGRMNNIVKWERNENEKNLKAMLFLQRELTEDAVDVVVSLDTSTTEALTDAVENLDKNVKIYAIGNSDKAVAKLDYGTIYTLGYQNEFSIGYIGVRELTENKKQKALETGNKVEYRIVTKKTLYDADNQKMLFPFIK